ncbi:MAG: O-antigen ligase family protein, partial [Caldilineaceae bacterium]|nr:O-antigen ligase family protein [Caldilineaceae bacterium]
MRHLRWLWPWVGGLTTLALSVPVLLPGHLIAVDRQWLLVLALAALVSTQLLYQRRIRRVAVHNAARTQSLRFAAVPQWPVWGLLLLTIMSTGIAIDRQAAWEAAGYLLLGLAFYLSLPQLPWLQRRPDGLAWALCLFGIGVLLLAPPLVEWKQEFRLFYVPIYDWFQLIAFDVGETIHANILAGALVPLVTLSAALALPPIQHAIAQVEPDSMRTKYVRIKRRRQERVQQIMAGSLAVCLLILLLLTQSRAAYLGIMVALLFLSILRWRRLRWLLPLLLLGVALQMYQVGLWQSFELLGADNTFGGAEWRTAIWQIAFQAIHDFADTGIGIVNFRPVLTMLYPHPALTA